MFLSAEEYKDKENLLISMNRGQTETYIPNNITEDILNNKDTVGVSCSDLPQEKNTPKPARNILQRTKKRKIIQKIMNIAAALALTIGAGTMGNDSRAEAINSFANITSGSDVETQILQEQNKHRKFLPKGIGSINGNRSFISNTLSVNPKFTSEKQSAGLLRLSTKNTKIAGTPTGFAASPIGRQVVESGATVEEINGTFNGHDDSNLLGQFINNKGTIEKLIAEATGNILNLSGGYSGLIYNEGTISSLTGTYLNNTINSTATSGTVEGAAIWNTGTMSINAANADVLFSNNSVQNGDIKKYNDVYNQGTINLNAGTYVEDEETIQRKITFDGAVIGENGKLVLNNDSDVNGGVYEFNSILGGKLEMHNSAHLKLGKKEQADGSTTYGVLALKEFHPVGGTVILDLRNDHIDTHHFGAVTQDASVNHLLDVDLVNIAIDNFTADSTTAESGNILIGAINLIAGAKDAQGNSPEMRINFSRNSFRFATALTHDIMDNITYATGVDYIVDTLDYDLLSGDLIFNAAEFIPNGGSVDKVYKTSSEYLALENWEHAQYHSADIVDEPQEGYYIVVLNGKVYYFKPDESTDELNNAIIDLAATGSMAIKEVDEDDNYIFEKDGKYYTYSKTFLPKSVWEDALTDSSNYNYYEANGTSENYYNISLREKFMNAINTTVWTPSNKATADTYTWPDGNVPRASNPEYVTEGEGDALKLKSVNGMIRFYMPHNNTTETKYYKYEYTVPSDYTKADGRVSALTSYITNQYFYKLPDATNGGAIYNNTNEHYSINADFIGNQSSTGTSAKDKFYGGGAIHNAENSTLGYISGTFINNTGFEGGAILNNKSGDITAILGDFIGNSSSKSGGVLRNANGTIGLIQGKFIGNRAGTNGDGWGGAISNKVYPSDGSPKLATIAIVLGDFIANFAKIGGGAIDMNGELGTVIGDFIGNNAEGKDGGGAVRVDGGYIGSITGDFIGNSAKIGGAIITQGSGLKIGTVYGDFIGNSATSGNGGAIQNATNDKVSIIEGV